MNMNIMQTLLGILAMLIVCFLGGVAIGAIARGMRDVADDDPKEDWMTDRRTCDTCRYRDKNWNEDPCDECAEGDIDRWEPL